ncbi:hypothetical protein KIN34_02770 [Cellulomonas sp. DKR-3]|uniref:RHS repeat protein n=1 Tax=Cellulomonas fulva TaxID=2835530 RepID=A0ABS5TVN7_9CELL|nr:hypothetical protein [Cellulomonas fulva]
MTNGQGRTLRYAYDALGRKTSSSDAAGIARTSFELGDLGEGLVDRVDLDVAAWLGEDLGARCEAAAADLVGRLPHGVALEAGDLRDLPAEEAAVEAAGGLVVRDRDVDVRDVPCGMT